jgi:hypothetical protein
MPVALDAILAANALVSLDEAKAYLSVTRPTVPADLTPEDAQLVEAINWVSAFVESFARPMARATETLRLALPRTPNLLRLLRLPIVVTEPVTCALGDVDQAVWRQESDGARSGFEVLVYSTVPGSRWSPDALYRRSGWGGGSGAHWINCSCGCGGAGSGDPQPILLTYTGGFDCLPAPPAVNALPRDVHVAVLDTVRAWSRNQQQGTADIEAIAQPGGGPTFTVPRWLPYGALQTFLAYRPTYAGP